MKIDFYKTALIDEWPTVSFDIFENVKIENPLGHIFYKSFFVFLRLPEILFSSFVTLFTSPVR